MSAGAVSGRPRSPPHSGTEAMRWRRRRPGSHGRRFRNGRRELAAGVPIPGRIRRPGAGRPCLEQIRPELTETLVVLIEPVTRGDPMSPLRWTWKSKAKLAGAVTAQGWPVSASTMGRLLHRLGFRLYALQKTREGGAHPDRNAQFEHINATATAFIRRQQPVISAGTTKKELVGDFKNAGREWQALGTASHPHPFHGNWNSELRPRPT